MHGSCSLITTTHGQLFSGHAFHQYMHGAEHYITDISFSSICTIGLVVIGFYLWITKVDSL